MDIEYRIRRNRSGAYDILKNGQPLFNHSVTDSQLRKQLDPVGIMGEVYEDVRRQLAESDEATVSIPRPGKFFQG